MSDKEQIARLSICIPDWLDARMRERAPIRKRGDLNKFFIKLLMEKFGDAPLPLAKVEITQTSQ